ncbi:RNase H domain-containing protein [Trichonephila clavipes]|nr:RNase H domain-containing protein [Trichonephila clavipes]
MSKGFKLSQGLPQGSVRSPSLFTVFMCNIEEVNSRSHIKLRNSDGCSAFHSELIAIDTGLKEALSIPDSNSVWILSDSRSVIQHLSKWHKVGDNTGVAILEKLKHLSLLLARSIYNGFLRPLT